MKSRIMKKNFGRILARSALIIPLVFLLEAYFLFLLPSDNPEAALKEILFSLLPVEIILFGGMLVFFTGITDFGANFNQILSYGATRSEAVWYGLFNSACSMLLMFILFVLFSGLIEITGKCRFIGIKNIDLVINFDLVILIAVILSAVLLLKGGKRTYMIISIVFSFLFSGVASAVIVSTFNGEDLGGVCQRIEGSFFSSPVLTAALVLFAAAACGLLCRSVRKYEVRI